MCALYRHYRNSVFPFSGGLLEQPAFYKRAMEVLESAYAEIEAERAARAAKGKD